MENHRSSLSNLHPSLLTGKYCTVYITMCNIQHHIENKFKCTANLHQTCAANLLDTVGIKTAFVIQSDLIHVKLVISLCLECLSIH